MNSQSDLQDLIPKTNNIATTTTLTHTPELKLCLNSSFNQKSSIDNSCPIYNSCPIDDYDSIDGYCPIDGKSSNDPHSNDNSHLAFLPNDSTSRLDSRSLQFTKNDLLSTVQFQQIMNECEDYELVQARLFLNNWMEGVTVDASAHESHFPLLTTTSGSIIRKPTTIIRSPAIVSTIAPIQSRPHTTSSVALDKVKIHHCTIERDLILEQKKVEIQKQRDHDLLLQKEQARLKQQKVEERLQTIKKRELQIQKEQEARERRNVASRNRLQLEKAKVVANARFKVLQKQIASKIFHRWLHHTTHVHNLQMRFSKVVAWKKLAATFREWRAVADVQLQSRHLRLHLQQLKLARDQQEMVERRHRRTFLSKCFLGWLVVAKMESLCVFCLFIHLRIIILEEEQKLLAEHDRRKLHIHRHFNSIVKQEERERMESVLAESTTKDQSIATQSIENLTANNLKNENQSADYPKNENQTKNVKLKEIKQATAPLNLHTRPENKTRNPLQKSTPIPSRVGASAGREVSKQDLLFIQRFEKRRLEQQQRHQECQERKRNRQSDKIVFLPCDRVLILSSLFRHFSCSKRIESNSTRSICTNKNSQTRNGCVMNRGFT